ncbi:5'-nucleotidase C-terminal domain-containing protein [Aegicerativicinus sediminis]
MKFRITILLILSLAFISCERHLFIGKIVGKQININDSISSDPNIEAYVKPYRENIEKDLNEVITYSDGNYTKNDGKLNTAIGNLIADAVYEESNPIYNSRTGKNIDFVMLNHGGIRADLPKGPITKRNVYEIMPFENSMVVTELSGDEIKDLLGYLVGVKRAHPISKLQIVLDKDGKMVNANVDGQPIDYNRTYNVATNDFLYNGGDHMDFFKRGTNFIALDYKIRNILLDYFQKADTLKPRKDNRFIQQ